METPTPDVYFAKGFDHSKLKVAQLRGILVAEGRHNVLTGNWRKQELVQEFTNHVLPKAQAYRDRKSVAPSGRGIVAVANDGTESLLEAEEDSKKKKGQKKTPSIPATGGKRGRSSKSLGPSTANSSRTVPAAASMVDQDNSLELRAVEFDEPLMSHAPSPKKPRLSKAVTPQPTNEDSSHSLPSTTGKRPAKSSKVAQTPSLDIASDVLRPDDHIYVEEKKVNVRAPRRSLVTAGSSSVQQEKKDVPISIPTSTTTPWTPKHEALDSGFSNANPFQAGSAQAAEKVRRKQRQSLGGALTSRRAPRPSDVTATSSPGAVLRRVGPSQENLRLAPAEFRQTAAIERERLNAENLQRRNDAVGRKLTQISSDDIDPEIRVVTRQEPPMRRSVVSSQRPAWKTILPWAILFTILSSWLIDYKNKSSSIGFCDSNSSINPIILNRAAKLNEANACVASKYQHLKDHPDEPPYECDDSGRPLLPMLPRPIRCTPCPAHGVCQDGEMKACAPEYILSPGYLSFLTPVLDGLPGLGPRAFPPTCKPDTVRKRRIGGLARDLESYLAKKKGDVICAGGDHEGKALPKAMVYGVESAALRDTLRQKHGHQYSEELFEEYYNVALQDLLDHHDAVEAISDEGHSWYAASRSELTTVCKIKLQALRQASRWKAELGGTTIVLLGIAILLRYFNKTKKEKYNAKEMVDVVLRRLQDQASMHATNPTTAPNPFLAADQLRDLLLTSSTASRESLWQRVTAAVESNANVATREREVHGEVWKTWEWTGEKRITW